MDLSLMLSIVFGAVWSAANVWCLVRLLNCWAGPRPSWRRALAWSAVKFLALYGAAAAVLASGRLSLLGFSIGFTVTLIAACAQVALRSRNMVAVR
jgi:hypothetical protein